MRKLVALFAVTVVAASALAQGTVSFNNNSAFATVANRLVNNVGGAPLVGTDFVAQLYFGSAGTAVGSLTAVTTAPARFRIATTSSPGTWSGGTRTLDGIASGVTATLQVRVWNATAFPAGYDAAVAGGGVTGFSDPFAYTVPAAGSPPAAFFMENMRGFTLVPEPSTIALGVLGLAGLVFIRRRK
jgi:hypothetical protein